MLIRKLIFQSSIDMERSLSAIKRNKAISCHIIYKVIQRLISSRCADIYNALVNPDTKSNSDEDLYASIYSILEIRACLLIISKHIENVSDMHALALHIRTAAETLATAAHDVINKIEQQKNHAQRVGRALTVGFLVSGDSLIDKIHRRFYPVLASLLPYFSLGTGIYLKYRDAIQKSLNEREDLLADMITLLGELNNKRRSELIYKLVCEEVNDEIEFTLSNIKSVGSKLENRQIIPVLNSLLRDKKDDKQLQRFILNNSQLDMNSFILGLMNVSKSLDNVKPVSVYDMKKTNQTDMRKYKSLFSIQQESILSRDDPLVTSREVSRGLPRPRSL